MSLRQMLCLHLNTTTHAKSGYKRCNSCKKVIVRATRRR